MSGSAADRNTDDEGDDEDGVARDSEGGGGADSVWRMTASN